VSIKKVLIIIDSIVKKHYYYEFESLFSKDLNDEIYCFTVTSGKRNKSIDTCEKVYKFLIEHNFSRKDFIIGFGGGTVSDVTGFVAATYMRGVDYALIPTTLLSMADSSIGGKTAINVYGIKNAVGAFKNPLFVYDNISLLNTLKDRDFACGLSEVIKHALISDAAFFEYIENNKAKIVSKNYTVLKYVINKSVDIKKSFVLIDPYDLKERRLLNFGHTLGHAIETNEKLNKNHGECVAIGIRMAMEISAFKDMDRVIRLFHYFGLDTDYAIKNQDKILKIIKNDKKCFNDKIEFIYLKSIGKAYIKELSI
ncbi:MAG: 3-dehydroquinate synthase, partial [Lachnospiraceae bacterium]|nr:3-dehydroquinate synthase [Lachnospiraceae bacterium]